MPRGATVDVSVRVRPNFDGFDDGAVGIDRVGGLSVAGNSATWNYASHVVTGSDQGQAYDLLARPLLAKLESGYSCTLVAYGQTGSGKTYTIFGPPGCLTESALAAATDGSVPADWGILPRLLLALLESRGDRDTLHVSAIEIYAETCYDLLNGKETLAVGSSRRKRMFNKSAQRGQVEGVGGSIFTGSGMRVPGPDLNGASCTPGLRSAPPPEDAPEARS
jgi:hypothetical protein